MAATTPPDEKEIRQRGWDHLCDVAHTWRLYLALAVDFNHLPSEVRLPVDDIHDPDTDLPYKEIGDRCSDAFDFGSYFVDIDRRIEIVGEMKPEDEQGGPPILWKTFAPQKAYYASIDAALKVDLERASDLIEEAKKEFVEVKKEGDIQVLRRAWEKGIVPVLDSETDPVKKQQVLGEEINCWVFHVGEFVLARLRFRDDPVAPHGYAPGYPYPKCNEYWIEEGNALDIGLNSNEDRRIGG